MISIQTVIDILHAEGCSCVIRNGEKTLICRDRGVRDLFRILSDNPEILNGAYIADKVVGKGAAALMIAGKTARVYADVISRPALTLFGGYDVNVEYGVLTDHIINRKGDGICPVEALCAEADTAEECIPLIEKFINKRI